MMMLPARRSTKELFKYKVNQPNATYVNPAGGISSGMKTPAQTSFSRVWVRFAYLLMHITGLLIATNSVPNILSKAIASRDTGWLQCFFLIQASLIILYFILVCSDPGVLKPPTSTEEESFLPKGIRYQIDDKDMVGRYCSRCKFITPPRGFHCKRCGHCVAVFDHHCPMTSTCVGQRNHRIFLLLIATHWLFAMWSLYQLGKGVIEAFSSDGFSLGLLLGFAGCFGLLAAVLVTGLLFIVHCVISLTNKKTVDIIRFNISQGTGLLRCHAIQWLCGVRRYVNWPPWVYDKGCFQNLREFCTGHVDAIFLETRER